MLARSIIFTTEGYTKIKFQYLQKSFMKDFNLKGKQAPLNGTLMQI